MEVDNSNPELMRLLRNALDSIESLCDEIIRIVIGRTEDDYNNDESFRNQLNRLHGAIGENVYETKRRIPGFDGDWGRLNGTIASEQTAAGENGGNTWDSARSYIPRLKTAVGNYRNQL